MSTHAHAPGRGECAPQRCAPRRVRASREAPPSVHDVLRSPGRPLDASTRSFMESAFGHALPATPGGMQRHPASPSPSRLVIGAAHSPAERDANAMADRVMGPAASGHGARDTVSPRGLDFGHIRVHDDSRAAASARQINALAYAAGPHLVFGPQIYQPSSAAGRRLIAHELAHTVQQASGMGQGLVQRMAPCPATYPETVPTGWKKYYGDSCYFHCCYRGILEDRKPADGDPQNECFYDTGGALVTETHPFAGCRGTPNSYDSESQTGRHATIDPGGVVRSGPGAFVESTAYKIRRGLCAIKCQFVPGFGKFFCLQQCLTGLETPASSSASGTSGAGGARGGPGDAGGGSGGSGGSSDAGGGGGGG